ncbi:hypothetical protein HNY73_015098 [Argiope bruennichi]|uniref:Uncharacterized protein n=1 Tax=Argiope bruennichi TaxID=94029 RepID=A0A8T0ERK1_ARGBR|nr:hypothetical protein HNY73_015098 [Argiope bruennichi]
MASGCFSKWMKSACNLPFYMKFLAEYCLRSPFMKKTLECSCNVYQTKLCGFPAKDTQYQLESEDMDGYPCLQSSNFASRFFNVLKPRLLAG